MYIKDSPVNRFTNDFSGFELDASKIKLHSAHKQDISLPYSGPLPDGLQSNDGAFISFSLAVGLTISVGLTVTVNGKNLRYPVAATPQEINDILFQFFFEDVGNNEYHTRFGIGLDNYWLGNYQSSYTHWRRFVVEGHGIDSVLNQLSPAALDKVVRYINYKKTA